MGSCNLLGAGRSLGLLGRLLLLLVIVLLGLDLLGRSLALARGSGLLGLGGGGGRGVVALTVLGSDGGLLLLKLLQMLPMNGG